MERMEDNRLFNIALQERHWREEEMLGNVKGGAKSVVRLRTCPEGLNPEITEEEKDNIFTNLTLSYLDPPPQFHKG
jgi:hypothetical protein